MPSAEEVVQAKASCGVMYNLVSIAWADCKEPVTAGHSTLHHIHLRVMPVNAMSLKPRAGDACQFHRGSNASAVNRIT